MQNFYLLLTGTIQRSFELHVPNPTIWRVPRGVSKGVAETHNAIDFRSLSPVYSPVRKERELRIKFLRS